jgi:hypothetical protein
MVGTDEGRAMSWEQRGTYFENCTCEGACPCTASSLQWPADKDFCDVMFAFHVDSGEIDGTAVEDLSVVLLVHSPQAQITDGNLTVGLYVDERASAEQAEKLGAVFSGQVGGPMAAIAPLIGEVAGLERAPISFAEDGLTPSGDGRQRDRHRGRGPDAARILGADSLREHRAPGGPIGDGGACDELAGQRLRHRVRGQGWLVRPVRLEWLAADPTDDLKVLLRHRLRSISLRFQPMEWVRGQRLGGGVLPRRTGSSKPMDRDWL